MTKHVSRRIFLKGVGGACVAAPFLSTVADGAVKSQAATPPKRLIVMFTHYGCITTRFFPKKAHGALTAADLQPTTLKHLAPFVDKLLLPRGIRAMNEWTARMVRGQGNDPHTQVVGSYFTCEPVTPNSNDPFSFDQATKFNAKPMGPSLDHVMAQQLSPNGAPLLIALAGQNDSPQSAISYSAAETIYPSLRRPSELFAQLTGLFQGGAPMSPDTYQAARGKSVLDLVRDDLETLQRFDMSKSDRNKLEAWKALLHDSGRAVTAAQCNSELALELGATQENVDAWSVRNPNADALTNKITPNLDAADLFTNLAVLASLCQINPVIFLKYPANYLFRGLGVNNESASLAHRMDNAGMVGTCVPNAIELILRIDDYYARKFAHLVGQLNRIDEGDGTALDHSAAVWFQQMSDGCAQNLNNIPIVQAGSAGGYFKTGCAVNVEDGSPDLTNGNSEIFCTDETNNEVDGVNQLSGTDPKFANAPINKYYCNLMNALGVKAGADGFPMKGGTAEVTHFGRYDRTEDFIGGGTKPAQIHDPGAFAALKANT